MNPKPSPWRWSAVLLAGILSWYVSQILALAALALSGGNPQDMQGVPLVIYAVVRLVAVAAGITLALRIAGLRLADLGLVTRGWQVDSLIGLTVGILLPVLQFTIIIPLTGGAARSDVAASRALIADGFSGLLAAILMGWLVGGIAEELYFRGHLITGLRNLLGNQPWSVAAAALLSSLYFGAAHTYQGWAGMLDTGVFGLILAGLYVWRGRLTPAIIAHGTNNTLLLIGLYLWY